MFGKNLYSNYDVTYDVYNNIEPIMDASTSIQNILYLGDNRIIRYNDNLYRISLENETNIVTQVAFIRNAAIEGDIKSVNKRYILMENGLLYIVDSLTATNESNLEFNEDNMRLDIQNAGVKELLSNEFYVTEDNKLYRNGFIVTSNLDRIIDYTDSSFYYINQDGALYEYDYGSKNKVADNVVSSSHYCYKTADGKIYNIWNNNEITENLEEIEENLEEYEYFYDVNDSSNLSQFRNLETVIDFAHASYHITYLKENGGWYYNTEYLGGGVN